MKPVAICRYAAHEGPGYFATYLSRRRIPYQVVKIDEGESLPRADAISGLATMGGAMSVNDDLPWIAPMLALIRDSVAADVPVIGHCLGGQLLAKALGARVQGNPVKEIGWGVVSVLDVPEAREWSAPGEFLSFHWHGETFAVPDHAVRVWSSAHCINQAFAFGKHFGMQCHVEMTEEMITRWCETGCEEIEANRARSPAVQTPAQMHEGLAEKLTSLQAVATRVYDRWTQGLTSP